MKREFGSQGEEIAARYLQEQGYKILQRNYHTQYGEVDIVCSSGQTIVFVEVKTRANTSFGFPEEAVTKTKQEHIRKTALAYLQYAPHHYKEIRFDVIGILFEETGFHINHLPAAF